MEELHQCDLKLILQELIQGRDAAARLQGSLLGAHEDEDMSPTATREDLALVVDGSFCRALSILGYGDAPESDGTHLCSLPWTDPACLLDPTPVVGGRIDGRGRYKRRKSCNSWTETTPALADDGYSWRKYGQKLIQGSDFPRSYFRCTHKSDQGCEAVKQVQQISEVPPSYRTTCYGHHTCKNNSFPQQFAIPDEETESKLISFDKTPRRNMTDEGFFPSAFFSEYFEAGLMGGGRRENVGHNSQPRLC